MLEQPGGWMPGDAAVVLLPGHTGPDAARERLIARLLHEGAAVLVLYAPRGVAADVASANPEPRALPREFLPVLFGALMVLRRDYGAGEVVALGHGAAAVDEAALQAASEITASAFLGSDAQRYAATAGLGGPGRAAGFEPGATPPSSAEWRTRVPLLCAILGSAAAELMQLQPVEVTAAMAERDCSMALLRPDPFAAVQDLP
jgi:hypothetical protein